MIKANNYGKYYIYFEYFSALICFVFLLISVILFITSELKTLGILMIGVSFFSLLGVINYLFRDNRCKYNWTLARSVCFGKNNIYYLIFIALYVGLLGILYFATYIKPIEYYILLSLFALMVIANILYVSKKSSYNVCVLLLFILVLAIVARASTYSINPYITGIDSYYHFNNINSVIVSGEISRDFDQYYHFPSYYYLYGICGNLLSFSKNTFQILNISFSVVSVLLAFSIARSTFNSSKSGLLAALLVSISTLSIYCVTFNQGKIAGISLLLLVILILISIHKYKSPKYPIILWFSLIALYFWHPEVSLPVILILGAYFILCFVYKLFFCKNFYNTPFLNILIGGPLLTYILIYMYHLFVINTFLSNLIIHEISKEGSTGSMMTTSKLSILDMSINFFLQHFVSYLCISFVMFFLVIQLLLWLKKPSKLNILYSSIVVSIFLTPLLGLVTGKMSLGGERSLIVISTIILVFSSNSILRIICSLRKKNLNLINNRIPIISVFLIFFFFFFFTTTSYYNFDGNKIFNDEINIDKIYLTYEDRSALNFRKNNILCIECVEYMVYNGNLMQTKNQANFVYNNGEKYFFEDLNSSLITGPYYFGHWLRS
ncbi:hypothetical protein [Methanoplanus limicola]|uniref:Glycosyltransferase RgtA/B/C/D-like domain-containing protein n=1 Tax=Methanoplanus limicola DSM 2279 TaxID=937775 RepID=H1Z0C7_9EURY|nr:hypothetical protein [Methanoplanus limicola]EHQ34394.1 hypothetical protein Metlim_0247 [Methanoplanus limicola DSM 2279]